MTVTTQKSVKIPSQNLFSINCTMQNDYETKITESLKNMYLCITFKKKDD